MRCTRLLAVLALLTNACATSQYVRGSADFTSTPQVGEHSGALPLTALVCVDPSGRIPSAGARLGDDCDLRGRWTAIHSRNGFGFAGGSAQLASATGRCELPTATGPIPIRVDAATLEMKGGAGGATNVTVGGTTSDARYVTYRFTGMYAGEASGGACERVLRE
jgi:hypothetical protein